MYKRIVLAYDGSVSGQKALLDCRDMAHLSKAELFLIAVMPLPVEFAGGEIGIVDQGHDERERQQYQAILDEGLRRLAEAGHTPQGEVVVGDAVDEIANCARRVQADLIIVGHKHLQGWARRWWRGSVSKALIEQAPCSVLVVITP
jgi:nucleotide-binding universal stress UspA family protein